MTLMRAIITLVFLFGVVFFLWILPRFYNDECFEHAEVVEVKECLREKAHHVAMSGDIGGAMEYAVSVIAPYNRTAVHFAMHMIGMEAYRHFQSREEAMGILPSEAATNEKYLTYEGYQHGVLMEYFKEEKAVKPMMELIRESCNPYWRKENPPTVDFTWRASLQCFHAVGHGLMHAYENDLSPVLSDCTALPYEWMKERCAYGALMEKSYSFNLEYAHAVPSSGEKNMLGICNSLSRFTSVCALFVGRSHLSVAKGDYAGAFGECAKLHDRKDADSCREQIAAIPITDAGTDFDLMRERCRTAGLFEEQCLVDVARAVNGGLGGEAARKKDFCNTLDSSLRVRCTE